jgi:ferredoxin
VEWAGGTLPQKAAATQLALSAPMVDPPPTAQQSPCLIPWNAIPGRGAYAKHDSAVTPTRPSTKIRPPLAFSSCCAHSEVMASLDTKWLVAQLNLAWRVVVHAANMLVPRRARDGLAQFHQNYLADALVAATPASRALSSMAGRCTVCGLCDDVCPLLRTAHDEFMGPQAFVVSGLRATPQLVDLRSTLQVLQGETCRSCRACVSACPVDIPILELAQHQRAALAVVDDNADTRVRAREPALASFPFDERTVPDGYALPRPSDSGEPR